MVGLLLVLVHVISRTLVELRGGISRRSFRLFLYVIKYNQMLFVWLSDRTRLIQKKETSWMGLLHVDKDVLFLIANYSIASIDLIKINDILVNFNGSILSPTGPILMKKYMYVYIEKKIGHVARHTSIPADGSKWQPKTPQEQLFRLVQFLQIRANERHFIAPKIALPCSCSLQFQLAFHVFRHMTALGDASLRIVRMVQIKIVKEIKRYSSAVGGRVCLW